MVENYSKGKVTFSQGEAFVTIKGILNEMRFMARNL